MQRCFALGLGLAEDHIVAHCQRAPIWPVTIAHYPEQPQPPPPGTERINPHWDRDMFALVTTNDAGSQRHGAGIQILLDEIGNTLDATSGAAGQWCDVPIEPGGCVASPRPQSPRLGRRQLVCPHRSDCCLSACCMFCARPGMWAVNIGECMTRWCVKTLQHSKSRAVLLPIAGALHSRGQCRIHVQCMHLLAVPGRMGSSSTSCIAYVLRVNPSISAMG